MKTLHIILSATVRWWNASAFYTLQTARALRDMGHHVVIVGGKDTPIAERAVSDKFPLIDEFRFKTANLLDAIKNISLMRKIVLEEKIDIVNPHRPEDHFWWALALRGMDVPLIRTLSDQRTPKNHFLARYLNRRLTDGFIATASTLKQRTHETFKNRVPPIYIVHGGIKVPPLTGKRMGNGIREMLGLRSSSFIAAIMGRLSPEKGHETFLRAAGKVAEKCDNAYFLVVGADSQIKADDLKNICGELGIRERVFFMGYCEDLNRILVDIDVGVISSLFSEVVSRSCWEYMSAGKAVVATEVNVLPEIVVNGETGFIVPPGDMYRMADALITLANDPVKTREMGIAGYQRMSEYFTLEKMGYQTETVFRRIISNNRHG